MDPATRASLWGGVPQPLLPGYTASMALVAAGFFAYTYFLLGHIDPDKAQIAGRPRYSLFHGLAGPAYLEAFFPGLEGVPLRIQRRRWRAVRPA